VLSRDGFVGRVERNLVSEAVAACEPSAECAYEGAIALQTLRLGGGLYAAEFGLVGSNSSTRPWRARKPAVSSQFSPLMS
jgi:hypothetical protein